MKAVLLAGGRGNRFRPYSFDRSKVMFKFLGKPLLFYHINEFLKNKIEEIIIVCNNENYNDIKNCVEEEYGKTEIEFVVQENQLGPAHALYIAKDLIKEEEFFLFKYADSICKEDIVESLLKRFSGKGDGIIVLRRVGDTKRYGIVKFDGKKVIDIIEKPEKNPPSNFGILGIGILRSKLFLDGIENDKLNHGKKEIPPPQYVLMEGGKLSYYLYEERRVDLGKTWDILLANQLLINKFGGKIEGKKIDNSAKISKRCYIGLNVEIGKGVEIKDFSSVEGRIGKGSVIENSIIMKGSEIGDGCVIESSVIGEKNIVGNFFKGKSENCDRFFVFDKYEKPLLNPLGIFTGKNVILESNLECKGGKIVYPNKRIFENIEKDYLTRVIVFDADNTLYATSEVARDADMSAMNFFAEQTNVEGKKLYEYWKNDIVKGLVNRKIPYKRHRLYSYKLLSEEFKLKDYEKAFDIFLKELLGKIRLMPGVKDVLNSLKEYKLVIISEDSSDLLYSKIKKLRIMKYFNLIINSDSLGVMKPSEDYLGIICKILSVSPYECIMVGDSYEKDLEIPQKKGAVTISYGVKTKADYWINSFSELYDVLGDC